MVVSLRVGAASRGWGQGDCSTAHRTCDEPNGSGAGGPWSRGDRTGHAYSCVPPPPAHPHPTPCNWWLMDLREGVGSPLPAPELGGLRESGQLALVGVVQRYIRKAKGGIGGSHHLETEPDKDRGLDGYPRKRRLHEAPSLSSLSLGSPQGLLQSVIQALEWRPPAAGQGGLRPQCGALRTCLSSPGTRLSKERATDT